MGSPGKVIRQVTEEEKKAIIENAQRYIDNWKRYVKDLKKI
jgi:carbonic anhydrase/acetyltransferase-like protein (isoleucine patch superfamily)